MIAYLFIIINSGLSLHIPILVILHLWPFTELATAISLMPSSRSALSPEAGSVGSALSLSVAIDCHLLTPQVAVLFQLTSADVLRGMLGVLQYYHLSPLQHQRARMQVQFWLGLPP